MSGCKLWIPQRVNQSDLGHDAGQHMPVRIEFIESPEMVASLMPELCDLLSDVLIEPHDTTVYKAASQKPR